MTTKIDKELLIQLVREEPRLWDQRVTAYHNRDIKCQLWESIGTQLQVSGEHVRKTWENIRDTFRRKLKTHTEIKSSQGASEIMKWPFFNSMMFLKDVMIPRVSSGNLPLTHFQNEFSPNDLSLTTLDKKNISDTEPDINCSSGETEASGSEFASFAKPHSKQQKPSSLSKKLNKNELDKPVSKKQNDYDSQVLEIEKRKINLMEQRFSRPTNNLQDDQDYAFFMSLLPSVKQLNQIEKMKLRMKIMNDVTDALEAHSSRIIPSPIDSPLSSPSEHSQSSSMCSMSIQVNQASQPELLPPQQDFYNLMNLGDFI